MEKYEPRILRVNLNNRSAKVQVFGSETVRKYLGGAGLASYVAHLEIPPHIDPLAPENKLIFMTGPLTGTMFPASSRYEVCTKSPLTGIWADASSGGEWGFELKRSGYEGIIVEGCSEDPVYVSIQNGKVEFRDGKHLWGKDAYETQGLLKQELADDKARVACIGPAGEKKVLISCIVNDEGRTASRAGVGAVMGSKNLKAIAVRGTRPPYIADKNGLIAQSKMIIQRMKAHPAMQARRKYGTAQFLDVGWALGGIPFKNWQASAGEDICRNLGGEKMTKTLLKPHRGCRTCPVGCARWIEIKEGSYKMEGPGPEYETLAALGTLCANDSLESVCFLNDLCNRYGLDTISVGNIIAFAMEAYESGIITRKDVDGIEITWGNEKAMIALLQAIGQKRGLGQLLGKGVKRASQELGRGTEKFAAHVNGLEIALHDPRAFFSMAGNYVTSPRGACHLHGTPFMFETGAVLPQFGLSEPLDRFGYEKKGLAIKLAQDYASLINSAVFCFIAGRSLFPEVFQIFAEALSTITAVSFSPEELLTVGERITNLQSLYNLRCGMPSDQNLPPRLLQPITDGPCSNKTPDVRKILEDYFRVRGWTAEGKPTGAKLSDLGLEEFVPFL